MPQTLLEMAKDLVIALIRAYPLSPDDARSLLLSTHTTLLTLDQTETSGTATTRPETPGGEDQVDWQRSISKYAITCLECGVTLRQLSARHLRVHDLNPRTYRAKYGIPRTQPLSARTATARRRELAREIRPWEKAPRRRGKTL